MELTEHVGAVQANLTQAEKLNTFMLVGQLHGVPRLNVKSFRWDATDIEGVDDQVFTFNNTCFPHAIGWAGTELRIRRMANALSFPMDTDTLASVLSQASQTRGTGVFYGVRSVIV